MKKIIPSLFYFIASLGYILHSITGLACFRIAAGVSLIIAGTSTLIRGIYCLVQRRIEK